VHQDHQHPRSWCILPEVNGQFYHTHTQTGFVKRLSFCVERCTPYSLTNCKGESIRVHIVHYIICKSVCIVFPSFLKFTQVLHSSTLQTKRIYQHLLLSCICTKLLHRFMQTRCIILVREIQNTISTRMFTFRKLNFTAVLHWINESFVLAFSLFLPE